MKDGSDIGLQFQVLTDSAIDLGLAKKLQWTSRNVPNEITIYDHLFASGGRVRFRCHDHLRRHGNGLGAFAADIRLNYRPIGKRTRLQVGRRRD